ncbi:UNVERIFIED_CONTAM: HrpA-like RNA helicase [Paenibacillus sp. PvR008]
MAVEFGKRVTYDVLISRLQNNPTKITLISAGYLLLKCIHDHMLTFTLMIMFGMFILALLTYMKKK